jgi:hypothetical protein
MKESISIRSGDVAAIAYGAFETQKRLRDLVPSGLVYDHLAFSARPVATLRGAGRSFPIKESRSPSQLVRVNH